MNPHDMPKQGQLNPIQPNMIGPSAGLNDDFLLDDSAELPEPKIHVKGLNDSAPGEVPTENDNVDLVAAAECECQRIQEKTTAALEELNITKRDLDLLRQRIQEEGGMCTSIALECNEQMPGFIDEENQPIGYFTVHPSKTMLQEALEAIDESERKAVAAYDEQIEKLKPATTETTTAA